MMKMKEIVIEVLITVCLFFMLFYFISKSFYSSYIEIY